METYNFANYDNEEKWKKVLEKNSQVKITKTSSDPHPLFPREARRKFFLRALLFLAQEAARHTGGWTSAGA